MKKIIYRVWFEVYFDPTMSTSSKQQYFLVATLIPKSCKLTSQVDRYGNIKRAILEAISVWTSK